MELRCFRAKTAVVVGASGTKTPPLHRLSFLDDTVVVVVVVVAVVGNFRSIRSLSSLMVEEEACRCSLENNLRYSVPIAFQQDSQPMVVRIRNRPFHLFARVQKEKVKEEYKQSPIGRTNKRIEFGKEERVNDEKREKTRTRGKEIRLLVLIGLLRSRRGRGGRVWLGKVVHDSFE